MQAVANEQTKKIMRFHYKGISGSTLKMIAMLSMLMDHIGLFLLDRLLAQRGIYEVVDQASADAFVEANFILLRSQELFRMFGKIAFPIFCFLLVQGFLHTHDIKKYLGRLFIFAIISEIPFNLALSSSIFYSEFQNIYFTLCLGVLALLGIKKAEEKTEWNIVWRILFATLVVGVCAEVAFLCKTDYDFSGVFLIVILYILRKYKFLSSTLGCTVLMEVPAFFSILPICLYNGQRGSKYKWIFYIFYPAHILLLYIIACILGLGQISLV